MLREKGWTLKEIEADEINRDNARRIKRVNPDTGSKDQPFVDPLLAANKPSAPQAMPAAVTFDGATQVDNAAGGNRRSCASARCEWRRWSKPLYQFGKPGFQGF